MTTPLERGRAPQTEPLAEKILERIEREQVTPAPRWRFELLDKMFWSAWAASLLFATAASAGMLFALANAGWEFRTITHDGTFAYLTDALPFFWIVAITLLVLFAHATVRRTKFGYRYPVKTLVGTCIAGILLGGGILFAGGFGWGLEHALGERFPMYHSTIEAQRAAWTRPERGLLVGEIVETEPGYATFTLRAFDGRVWIVNGDDLRERDRLLLTRHRLVRLVGTPLVAPDAPRAVFHACFTFPWQFRGHRLPATELGRGLVAAPMPTDGSSVRKFFGERSTECKALRPYDALAAKERTEFLRIVTSTIDYE